MTQDNSHDQIQSALIIPTHNAAAHWSALNEGIRSQSLSPQQVLVVDSSSTDGTEMLARKAGFRVIQIDQRDFNHGGTRQLATKYVPEAEILIYLTQDAILSSSESIRNILSVFEDTQIGAAYGRQLPRFGAGPLEAHARHFNYPPDSGIRTFESRKTLGFKAVFSSNSFAAYRRTALNQVGGFPLSAVVSEETIVFARLQMAGWSTAYVADATVVHSHGYTLREEFSRYFDIGVAYSRESWIEREFRAPYGEGRRFIISEIKYLFPRYVHLVPMSLLHSFVKVIGYQLGRRESHLPVSIKRALSSQKNSWEAMAAEKDLIY